MSGTDTDPRASDALAAALQRSVLRHGDEHRARWDAQEGDGLTAYQSAAGALMASIVGITPAERRALAAAFLDAETLAVAINTAQITASELRLGHDLRPVAERVLSALRRAVP